MRRNYIPKRNLYQKARSFIISSKNRSDYDENYKLLFHYNPSNINAYR